MSISSVKTGAVGVSLLAGNTAYDPGGTFLIQRVTPSAGATSVTFSSIPQNYKHLQIRALTRNAASFSTVDQIRFQINGSTSSIYDNHRLYGTGSAVTADALINFASAYAFFGTVGDTALANTYGAAIIDIHDYNSTTKNKTIRAFSGTDLNGSGTVNMNSSLWRDTSAITSLTFYVTGITSSDAMKAGTTFALYGMVG